MLLQKTGVLVRRDLIPTYFTDETIGQINFWMNCQTWGLPFSGGWAEMPAVYTDILDALKQFRNLNADKR